jgi:hypothetical protein
MFELAHYYEEYWKNRVRTPRLQHYRESFSKRPIPVKIDIDNLKQSFETEFSSTKNVIKQYLPDNMVNDVERVIKSGEGIDSDLWAEIVFNYAASYKQAKSEPDKYLLLDCLKTLWIGRFVSYAMQTKDMDINEAETVLQQQAETFEDKFDYLRSIY